jgi:hypothetical protein
MQNLMIAAYPQVALEAIQRGFDGSFERCIANVLKHGVLAGHSEAEVILQAASGDYLKAAQLITSSKAHESAHF